jgi:hypothetical protein
MQNFNVRVTVPYGIHIDVNLHCEYKAVISRRNIQNILITRFRDIFLITLFFVSIIYKMSTVSVFPNWRNSVLGFLCSGTSLHMCDYIITVPAMFCWSLDMDGSERNYLLQ